MIKAILGLGSNIGATEDNINLAIEKCTFLSDIKKSDIIKSKALLLDNSDPSWDLDYSNSAISGFTNLTPKELFIAIKQIEKEMGRNLTSKRYSPRIIDIDILFYGDQIINEKELVIPHPEFYNRSFVYEPVYQIESGFKAIQWDRTIKFKK